MKENNDEEIEDAEDVTDLHEEYENAEVLFLETKELPEIEYSDEKMEKIDRTLENLNESLILVETNKEYSRKAIDKYRETIRSLENLRNRFREKKK